MLERFKIFDCTACNGDGNKVTNGENVRDGYNITECDTCEGTGLREYQLRNELLIAVKPVSSRGTTICVVPLSAVIMRHVRVGTTNYTMPCRHLRIS